MDPPAPDDVQPVRSLDQIRSVRASNDYVERPAASFQAARSHPSLSQPGPKAAEWPQVSGRGDLPRSLSQHQQMQAPALPLSKWSTASSMSRSTTASDQRLLGSLTPSPSGQSLVRTQPQPGGDPKAEDRLLKGPAGKGPGPGPGLHAGSGHMLICEECGRCKCVRCSSARRLPSCWLCNQRCLCSPDSLLDYGTCLCCVKGLFYHCSSDDEDNCADDPCSCGPGACCTRWAAMSLLSLFLPCLCCYLPTRACLRLCQRGYDGLKRPGCRCKSHTNTVCRKISSSGGATFPKALDKPV
ncbi:protein sprouty homolog 3 [Tachyglossus aculeatus]|uniref:protein sprouty homolog 3 n=1 Tax=Tachyglossus aculeatus TaxID=9261 RepID=UPI0018F56225|nr:protein sprouty homolog 3 [Tachyglossus aculeatus]XP_038604155.1 protein sprouty homolog 3 [Tachyglossus aculeatus]XP_038604156.1 protein sprouty homolog 3 [Tachyglossus aculeatus]